MNYHLVDILPLLIILCLCHLAQAQAVVAIEDCGSSYIDPQDAIDKNAPSHDTLVYQTLFAEKNRQRAYYIDVNAFGGQQVDRATVKAIMPGGALKPMGAIAFGNCSDCVEGFALVRDDSLWVENLTDRPTMEMWLQSFNQPPFALTSNLQTLSGVGRLSGSLPPCAEGIYVEFIVYGNPASTSTEFATHILCPEIIRNCQPTTSAEVDCVKDSIYLRAIIPAGCLSSEANLSWRSEQGLEWNVADLALPLSGNEGWFYFMAEDDCCAFSDSVLVENPSFAEAGPDETVCSDSELTLSGGGGRQYFWEKENGERLDDSLWLIPSVQPMDAGRYILHAFNEEGCEDTDTLLLDVVVSPEPAVIVSDACLGDSARLSVENNDAFVQLDWYDPQNIPLTSPLIPNLQETDFGQYRLEAVDLSGCRVQRVFSVSGSLPPAFSYEIEDDCDSTRVFLTPLNYRYEWSNGVGGPILTTASGGDFELTITDSLGCRSSEIIAVPPPDGPEVTLAIEHPRCPNEYGVVEVNLADPALPAIFSIDGGETYTLSNRFENLSPGSYTLLVQDDLGCIQNIAIELIAPDTLFVELALEELKARPGVPVRLEAQTFGNIVRYQWLPKEIDSGTPITSFEASQNLDIRLIAEDERGCLVSDGFPLTIVLGDVYAPNAFSPDNDGLNDAFMLYSDNGSGEVIEYLRIYDRYGSLLFEVRDVAPNTEDQGWDGTYRGKELNAGVYVFHAMVLYGNGARKELMGDVALIR